MGMTRGNRNDHEDRGTFFVGGWQSPDGSYNFSQFSKNEGGGSPDAPLIKSPLESLPQDTQQEDYQQNGWIRDDSIHHGSWCVMVF
jgi:hypothetical protein